MKRIVEVLGEDRCSGVGAFISRVMTDRSPPDALVPLLWATNRIKTMPKLNVRCDVESLRKALVGPPHPTREYISSSSLRKEEAILSEYERVYEAHWQVRDAQLENRSMPKRFDPDVVYERHYGFNWLIGYMDQRWDDITTDT